MPEVFLSVVPNYPEAGGQATLTCSNTSTSQPPQYRPDFLYAWWENGTRLEHSDAVLEISPLTKEHHNTVYRCEGHEEDSNLADDASVTLDVTCRLLEDTDRSFRLKCACIDEIDWIYFNVMCVEDFDYNIIQCTYQHGHIHRPYTCMTMY